jgi:galactonate dehydratase
MKITKLETIRIAEFPQLLWLHIYTDEGLTGLGETFFNPISVESYIHEEIATRLIGRDALALKPPAGATSYWKPRRSPADVRRYFRQF